MSRLLNYLAAAAALMPGCALKGDFDPGTRKPHISYRADVGFDYLDTDSSFGSRVAGQGLDLDAGETLAARAGGELLYGTPELKGKAGLDVRANSLPTSDAYGHYHTSSTNRTSSVDHGAFTLIPNIGGEVQLGDFSVGLELGLPRTSYRAFVTRDNFKGWRRVRRDSWSGFGTSVGLYGGIKLRDDWTAIVYVGNESYSPELAGQTHSVDSTVFRVEFMKAFGGPGKQGKPARK